MDNKIHNQFSCPAFSINENFEMLSSNDEWKNVFDQTKQFSQLIEDQHQLKLLKSLLENKKTQFPIQIELELSSPSRKNNPYVWTILKTDRNEFNFYGYDLSQRKEIETRYERMYHSTTDAIMLLSPEKFTDCNQATLDIFKLNSVEEFTQCHPADLSPPFQPDGEASLDKANRMIAKALRDGKNFFEWTHRNSEGNDFPCEVLLSLIEIDSVNYIQASVRDISDRVQMQKNVDEARLSQVNATRLASLGEMAGGIAHEINNPIAVIRAQAELLQRYLKNISPEQAEPLAKGMNTIVSTVDRITKIINGLRSVSRDSSQDPMSEQDILEIVNETLTLLEEKFRIANINFNLLAPKGPIKVSCRPSQLAQVFFNLMNNSYDEVCDKPNAWIKIEIIKSEKYVTMNFSDSGTGIPKNIADKIFEPFYTTKDVGKGTGLGLSISKSIVENHQGVLKLDRNSPNTLFQVILPLIK